MRRAQIVLLANERRVQCPTSQWGKITLAHQPMRETYTVRPANERKVHCLASQWGGGVHCPTSQWEKRTLYGQPMREKYTCSASHTVRPANEGRALTTTWIKSLNNVQGEQKIGGRNLTLMETKKQCLFLKDRTVKMPVLTLKTAL